VKGARTAASIANPKLEAIPTPGTVTVDTTEIANSQGTAAAQAPTMRFSDCKEARRRSDRDGTCRIVGGASL
jgi:hypothetical protein